MIEPETVGAELAKRRIKQMEVVVVDAVRETPDATTLVFFTGNDALEYKPGQFLTIDPHQFPALDRFTRYLEDLKGKREPPRAYSMCSGPHEKRLAVTVKEELYLSGQTKYPPLLSPLLVHRTPRGTSMVVTGFTGTYAMPDDLESRADHVVHVVAGSGSVPNFSMLKWDLETRTKLRHTLIYSNKTYPDIIFRAELEELARKHFERLRVIHLLTREPSPEKHGPQLRRGRVSLEILREAIPDPSSTVAFACGPGISVHDRQTARERGEKPVPKFLENVLQLLGEVGLTKKQIHHESYG